MNWSDTEFGSIADLGTGLTLTVMLSGYSWQATALGRSAGVHRTRELAKAAAEAAAAKALGTARTNLEAP
jgi:hypothetical protein